MIDSTNPRVMADNIRHLTAGEQANTTAIGTNTSSISALQTFDTDETNTGMKWIDDKDIYRKVLTGTSETGTISITVLTLYIEQLTDVRIFVKDNDDVLYGIGYRYSNTLVYWNISSGSLNIVLGSTAPATPVSYVVILEYTKTDPAPEELTSPAPDDSRSIEIEDPEIRSEEIEPEVNEEALNEDPVVETKTTTRKRSTSTK